MHSLLKYKNLFTLHFLAKKTPTSVGIKLCIYTPCYSNRAYMHGYCSSCIWFFFLSPPLSLSFSLVWLSTSFEFPLFPSDHSNSAKKKKTIFQPPIQHNPTITTTTQTHQKPHSKSTPKSIKTKSNRKPIRKIQQKPTWKTQRKSIRSTIRSTLLLLPPHLSCYHHHIQPKWT